MKIWGTYESNAAKILREKYPIMNKMEEAVLCPYCGEEMEKEYNIINGAIFKYGRWYECTNCHSRSPYADTDEEAFFAANHLFHVKNEYDEDDDDLKSDDYMW